MKILFLCKYNAFRSKVAESYFNKINKNKKNRAISRGFILGGAPDKTQRRVAKRFKAEIKGIQRAVSLKELIDSDKIIVVANDIPKIMFNYKLSPVKKKIEIWKIKDEQREDERKAEKIVKKIIKKVKRLVEEFVKK